MWITKAEMRRLLNQISAAESRAIRAEDALAAERQSKDWLTLQLASRVVTKGGQYGLEHEAPKLQSPPAAHPLGFTHEPTDVDNAKLEYYIQCARNAGVPNYEEDARAKWEAEMRGELLIPTYDDGQ